MVFIFEDKLTPTVKFLSIMGNFKYYDFQNLKKHTHQNADIHTQFLKKQYS